MTPNDRLRSIVGQLILNEKKTTSDGGSYIFSIGSSGADLIYEEFDKNEQLVETWISDPSVLDGEWLTEKAYCSIIDSTVEDLPDVLDSDV